MADEIEPGPPAASTIVVGCGNLIRGDDAAGPVLVRLLAERGVPDGVRLVDGGTAGMDVAFALRGARRAIVVDASHLGVPPGTVHRVPGEELVDLRPPEGNLHRFRWDQALGFAQWLLGPDYPQDVTVWLVEGASFEPGAPLSPGVQAAVERVAGELLAELGAFPPGDPGADTPAARDAALPSPAAPPAAMAAPLPSPAPPPAAMAAALASPAAPPAAMAAPAAIWERIDTRASHRSQVVAGGPGGTGGAAEPGGGTGGPGGTGSPSGGAVTDR